jgi:hypothetical protein
MSNINRRKFLQSTAAAGAGLVIARFSHAQEVISEDNPTAVALGYKADHTEVDTAKYTRKAGPGGDNQQCTTCALYGKVDDEYGNCPLFAGKLVHANGWCSGYAPK